MSHSHDGRASARLDALTILKRFALLALLSRLALPVGPVVAQSPEDGFSPNINGTVNAVVVQPDGRILIGGSFSQVNGIPRNNIARLNSNGSLDNGFNPNASDEVWALAVEANGRILVGGDFQQIGGQTRPHLARLNASGSAAAAFSAPNGRVSAIFVQDDGRFSIGGVFSQVGTASRSRYARYFRLFGNTVLEPGNHFAAFDGQILAMARQSDGKIVVGGSFLTVNGQNRPMLARLRVDGSLDANFSTTANQVVHAITIQHDDRILVGGAFTQIGGQTRPHLARLNALGALDTGFNPAPNSHVYALAIQPDGHILAGGAFSQISGQNRSRLARFNRFGQFDSSFNPAVVSGGAIFALAALPESSVIAGGGFSQVGTLTRNRLARFYRNGRLDASLELGILGSPSIQTMARQPDGRVVVGGFFIDLGGVQRLRIGRVNVDGLLDPGFNPSANAEVFALLVQDNGRIVVGGNYTQIGGRDRSRLSRILPNGAVDLNFIFNANGPVMALADQHPAVGSVGPRIIAAGAFTQINGFPFQRLVRILPADDPLGGVLDPDFTPSVNADIQTVTIDVSGRILIGGSFTQVNGQTRNRIARLNSNGGVDASFSASINGVVHSILELPDGKLLVGGEFSQVNGLSVFNLVRLNANGTRDFTFPVQATGSIRTLALQRDGSVIVGGDLTSIGGQTRGRIARLLPTDAVDTSFQPNVNGRVTNVLVLPDGKIMLAGAFTNISGLTRRGLARISAPQSAMQSHEVTLGLEQNTLWRMSAGLPFLWAGGGPFGPHLVQVEISFDGVNFNQVGGMRMRSVSDGYLTDVAPISAPGQTYFLRTRGRPVTGNGNGSLVEHVQIFRLPADDLMFSDRFQVP